MAKSIVKLPHHEQQEYALNRPPYRQGRKLTAVKVYTVNDESQHLLVFGVPKIKLKDELHRLANRFGIIKSLTLLDDYPQNDDDKFSDVYHLHYRRIQAARFAKRQLDERCFFGGVLHVCYAPEFETVVETRIKLIQRRREVARRIEDSKTVCKSDLAKPKSSGTARILQRSRKHPALPLLQNHQCSINLEANTIRPLPTVAVDHTNNINSFTNLTSSDVTNAVNTNPGSSFKIVEGSNSHQNLIEEPVFPLKARKRPADDTLSKCLLEDECLPSKCKILEVNTCPPVASEDNKKLLSFLPRQVSRLTKPKCGGKIIFHKNK